MTPSSLFRDIGSDTGLVKDMMEVCRRRDDRTEGGRDYSFALESRVSSYFPKAMSAKERRHLCEFLASMLQVNPIARVQPTVLLTHPWLSEIGGTVR